MNQEDDYGSDDSRHGQRNVTRTPGKMYLLRQAFPSLAWQVVQVDEAQGRAMRERGDAHVYDTSAQAYAVATRLRNGAASNATASAPFEVEPLGAIDEVNRLRGLIRDAVVDGDHHDHGPHPDPSPCPDGCPWPALVAEAEKP